MRSYQRLLILLVVILLASCVVGSALKPVVDGLVKSSAYFARKSGYDETSGTYNYGKIFRRIMMLTALVAFIALRRWIRLERLSSLGLSFRRGWWRLLLNGLIVGIVSLMTYTALLWLFGVRHLTALENLSSSRVLRYALQGLAVGFIEETIFRGFLLQTALRDGRKLPAVVLVSAVYSGLHFLRGRVTVTMGFDALVGFRSLAVLVTSEKSFTGIVAPFVGLLFVGVVLSYAYLWTKSLYLPIGLHAGWVFALKCSSRLLDAPTRLGWLYGSSRVVDGVGSLVLLAIVMYILWRVYGRNADEERSAVS